MPFTFDKKYLDSINIKKQTIEFIDIHSIDKIVFDELVRLYMNVYNADNIRLVKELGIKGATEDFGTKSPGVNITREN